jgi:hypothetical protein
MRRLAAFCVFVLVAITFTAASSAPAMGQEEKAPALTKVRVGLQTIVVPTPTPELVEAGSDYRVLLEPLAPMSNRLVAGFILPEELKAIQSGTTKVTRYALVEVPRRAEFADVNEELFKQIADSAAQQFNVTLSNSMKDLQAELELKVKSLGQNVDVKLDQPVPLGALFNKPNEVGLGMVMTVNVDGTPVKMAGCVGILRVKNRILNAYLFTPYAGEESVKWLRTTGEQWADAMLKANQ